MSDHPPRHGQPRHHDGDHRTNIEWRHGVLQSLAQSQASQIEIDAKKAEPPARRPRRAKIKKTKGGNPPDKAKADLPAELRAYEQHIEVDPEMGKTAPAPAPAPIPAVWPVWPKDK